MAQYLSYVTRTDKETGKMSLPEGKRKIFISYKHSDEAALPLCEKISSYILDRLDVAIWYDRQLKAGSEYDAEIEGAISSSDAFVLLLTPTILSSDYITGREIPLAIKNQVAIIPVIAGLSEEDIPKAEALIGKIHMPVWFFGRQESVPEFKAEAKEQFISGLTVSIANKDLLQQAFLFYERGNQALSLRYLTPEQVFVKAYGCLFGVESAGDKSLGVRLMESILSGYASDEEFVDLQKQVASELLKHLYRTNQPELFFPYMRSALEKGYDNLFPLLFEIYQKQWNAQLLCYESELSRLLFESLYNRSFGSDWQIGEIVGQIGNATPVRLEGQADESDENRIGELCCDGHRVYFRRSSNKEKTVELVIDGIPFLEYDVYASCGDVYLLYLACDESNRVFMTLYTDFDHYGPESMVSGTAFRIDADGIRATAYCSDWVKGLRRLPYSPFTFGIG